MRTRFCDDVGIEAPIFAFTHCRDVVVAVSKAGGLGVLGAGFMGVNQLRQALDWIDAHIGDRPYGVDVGEDLELIVDGGIRRGSHIFKALALGASACSIGRPYLYGLATGGESGVAKAIDILASETRRCMLLAGYDSIKALRTSPPVRRVGQT